jgi:hypothetical protein
MLTQVSYKGLLEKLMATKPVKEFLSCSQNMQDFCDKNT